MFSFTVAGPALALELPSDTIVNVPFDNGMENCPMDTDAVTIDWVGYESGNWTYNVTGNFNPFITYGLPNGTASNGSNSCGISVPFAWPVTCGDGYKTGAEACDDDNAASGDGCSSSCAVESGWTCDGATPDVCTEDTPDPVCGNGTLEAGEECDDGGTSTGDGCDDSCAVEFGWTCDEASPTVCTEDEPAVCGDDLCSGDESPANCVADCGVSLLTDEQVASVALSAKATGRSLFPLVSFGVVFSVAIAILVLARESVVTTIITPFSRR